MKDNRFKEMWKLESNIEFKGWDFSYLKDRLDEEALPWAYIDIVKNYLHEDYKLLDMGTGGGEMLLSLNHTNINTSVTEGWKPNLELCKEKLEPLGITVKEVLEDNKLDYATDSFDVVINRHEEYDIKEVKRVLKDKGIFITQQVGYRNNERLSQFFDPNFTSLCYGFDLNNEIANINEAGFEIVYKNEYYPYLKFFDVGAIVYFAKVIEWEFPNFSVDRHYDKLCELNAMIESNGCVESLEHRFIIVARNNKEID